MPGQNVDPTRPTTSTTTTTTKAGPGVTVPDTPIPPGDPVSADADGWKPLQLGAGGWVTGIDISDDGVTKLIRTDTYGGYRWDGAAWKQLVTVGSMPPEDRNTEVSSGIQELMVAPSDHTRAYMSFHGAVYRSTDAGDHWTKTSKRLVMDSNDPSRTMGERMAIDPVNPDVVYLGTTDALWRTFDGGATWAKVPESSDRKSVV